MSRAHTGSVAKKIIREIVQQCAMRGHVVSESLVAFMVKAVVLDPSSEFNVNGTLAEQDIQKLEELCLEKLTEECSPSLDTIKMQVYFDLNFNSRCKFLEYIHWVEDSRLSTVSREITDSRVKTREEFDALYRKMILFILLRSRMGSPTDVNAVQEATAALQSVFPQTELGAFMVLLKRDKKQQLNELSMIVMGIRLFNKASGKGQEETNLHELIPALLNEALPVTKKSIENELSVSQSLAWKYTAVLEKLTHPDSQPGDFDVPLILLRQALYNVRQHEAFLKMLLAEASTCVKHFETLQTELSSKIKLLKETVKTKIALHTAQVFPLFKALAKLWSGLQEEVELLKILNNIMLNLQPFIASQAKLFSTVYLDGLLEDSVVKTDEDRVIEFSGERSVPAEMKTQEWLLPETTDSFNELPLQYNGFCGYTLVTRDGLLLPGNPHIGVHKHKEQLYVFSSKEAALKFASSSDDFIAEVVEKAKHSPELIHLLKLPASCFSPYSELQPGESLPVKPVTKCESDTQTDIHPVQTNIIKSYEWNEWELRRQAIKLADLCTKVTRSVQTDLSHMRRQNVTQTWLPKNATCQSKRDGDSNVPKPHISLAGLRGQRVRNVVKPNMTKSTDV